MRAGGRLGDGKEDAMKRQKAGKPKGGSASPGNLLPGKGGLPLPLENRVPGARLVSVCGVTYYEFPGRCISRGKLFAIPLWAGLPCSA